MSQSPADRAPDAARGPAWVGSLRFERGLAVIVAVFTLLFALQSLGSLQSDWSWLVLGGGRSLAPVPGAAGSLAPTPGAGEPLMPTTSGVSPFGVAVVLLVVAAVVLGLVGGIMRRRVERIWTAAAAAYGAAVVAVLPVLADARPESTLPWLVAVAPIAVLYLAVAYRSPVVPVLAAVVLSTVLATAFSVLAAFPLAAVLPNALFDLALGTVLAVLIALVRRSVASADRAQRNVLIQYERSELDDATESERTRTDALVHDTVLTTLLQAASSTTPDAQDLAGRMADNALRVLAHLRRSGELGEAVPLRKAIEEAQAELDLLLPFFVVEGGELEDLVLPAQAAEVLIDAAIEAMRTSVQAGEQRGGRVLLLRPLGADGIRITVSDRSRSGETPGGTSPLPDRLVERLHRANARRDVEANPDHGTTVTVSWGSIVMGGVNPSTASGREVPA